MHVAFSTRPNFFTNLILLLLTCLWGISYKYVLCYVVGSELVTNQVISINQLTPRCALPIVSNSTLCADPHCEQSPHLRRI